MSMNWKQRSNLRISNLSLLFLVSVWKRPIIIHVLGLALGARIPSDTLYNALSPPRFQIERLKIYKVQYTFHLSGKVVM